MTFIEQLVQSLDVRLEQLRGEIATLTSAREELAADGAGATAATPASARRPTRRRDRRRATRTSSELVPAGELHGLLARSGGLSTAALSRQANADPARVLPLLRQMEAAGRIRRTGQRRGTRWHAVDSEEEWIAQRAAELAGRSRRG